MHRSTVARRRKVKGYLTKCTIFGEEASNRFPIHFTGREVNETLVVLRTVLRLNPKLQSSIPTSTHTHTVRESKQKKSNTHHRKRVDEVAVNGVERASVVIRGSAYSSQVNGLKQ